VKALVLRTPGERFSLRVESRVVVVTTVLAVALLAVMAATLSIGDVRLTPAEVLQALAGDGSRRADFVIFRLRLPRLLTAVFAGAALAVSGGLLQRLTGNSLGSPDIIGFTHGSATGALLVIIVWHGSMTQTALGALAGGLITALVVYLLVYSRGLHGFRLIVIGIGVSAMLLAANHYLITRASLQDALAAQSWLVGSLDSRGWEHAAPVGIALAVLLPLAFGYGRRLSMLEMGDDTAQSLGIESRRDRLVLLAVSVTLAAVATAATGPILFIALAAPQLTRRLIRSPGPGLVPAALMGALLLAGSDLAVQRIFAPEILPVGTATGTVGGLYLIWLLVTESRRRRT
jgi:iron complex transport system permease protein